MFKISKFSQLTNMTVRTLQYYDEIGLIAPIREENGHRVYTYRHLVLANEIKLLKEAGMTLEAIKSYFQSRNSQVEMDLQALLHYQKCLVQQQIDKLQHQLINIDFLLLNSHSSEQLDEAVIRETFINHNPFKKKVMDIWRFQTIDDWKCVQYFEKDIPFDTYFVRLANLQHLSIESPKVQQIIQQFITQLKEAYGSSLARTGIQEIAQLYQENSQAKAYLARYGQTFHYFLAKSMLVAVQQTEQY
ncbi:MerR family transcriptional regulator [Aerococcaceae bacterium NML130460]|nr:MerR family transcriptional regulator [Aerococcaceae bacterium NML180378]MCW6679685.1 MerR family transcriptional regulator [Aerococcaceae bacterium NML130460]